MCVLSALEETKADDVESRGLRSTVLRVSFRRAWFEGAVVRGVVVFEGAILSLRP